MTDIDTAAIRAEHTERVYDDYQFGIVHHCQPCGRDSYFPCLPLKLADALDAARAEAKCDHGKWRCKWGSEQRARAEAAEARITAAMAVIDESDREDAVDRNSTWPNPLLWGYTRTAAVRRALTGGTE